ncbi:MAG: hypothetical protein ABL921_20800 [Pirellula sp.]
MNTHPINRIVENRRSNAVIFIVATLALFVLKPLLGQLVESTDWRRTAQGWEYAHAIQASASANFMDRAAVPHNQVDGTTGLAIVGKWNRIVLPIAVCMFFLTFCWWLLIGVQNRGIVRRLSLASE